jgi:hypothetical protein
MTNKTVQALKITASWTPDPAAAAAMIDAVFHDKTKAFGVRFAGGRMSIKHAIRIDFADPDQATRVSQRVAQIKEELRKAGTIHDFKTTAGAVPVGEAEVLPDEDEAEAGSPLEELRTQKAEAEADLAQAKAGRVRKAAAADGSEAGAQ